jgi:hypothetical protein
MNWLRWFQGWPVRKEIHRRFNLVRHEDETGVSGTGIVAQGVQFSGGKVAMRWTTDTSSTTFFDSIKDVEAVHGHDGKTEVVWVD